MHVNLHQIVCHSCTTSALLMADQRLYYNQLWSDPQMGRKN